MRGVKGTQGIAWHWKDKARVRLIAASVPRRQIAYVMAVYDVLVLLCNDYGDKIFKEHVSTICQLTGMSYKGVARALEILSTLGLVTVSAVGRETTGVFSQRTFEIAKGPLALSTSESPTGSDDHQESMPSAYTSQSSASTSSIQPVELLYSESPNKERTEEQERKNDDDDAREPEGTYVASPQLEKALASHLGPFFWNQEILELVESYVREHSEIQLLKALQVAATSFVERKSLFSWLSTTLTSQKAQGYTWTGPPSKEDRQKAARQRRDPEAAFFEKQTLYRQLESDLSFGATHAWERIRSVAPRFGVDPAPFSRLDASPSPPKREQVTLIRGFVRAVLLVSSPPEQPHAVEGATA